MNHILVYFEK